MWHYVIENGAILVKMAQKSAIFNQNLQIPTMKPVDR